MTCSPSSLNESRIGQLPKFDSLSHTHSEVQVKWRVKFDLSHPLGEKRWIPENATVPHSRSWSSPPAAHALAWLRTHMWASAAAMPNVPVPDSCSAPKLSVCSPACKTRCSLSCSFPCTPGFGHGDWPGSLFAVDTLTADRPTVLSTHLCPHALRHLGSTHVPKQCKPRCCVHSHAFMCMLHKFSPLSLAGKTLQAKAQSMEAAVICRLSFKGHKWTKMHPKTLFFLFVEL